MSHPPPPIMIDPLSLVSLLLQTTCNGLPLGRAATGFVVAKDGKHYLITNWHVLAGRHPQTSKPSSDTAGVPDELVVYYHKKVVKDGQELTGWCTASEALNDAGGKPCWIEHPTGSKVDVAALPIVPQNAEITLHPLPLSLANTNLFAGVGETVSIIGYPFG